MTSRRRLTWVTALTVACLLLSGGALTALADEHGHGNGNGNSGKGHNNPPAKVEHQQRGDQAAPVTAHHDNAPQASEKDKGKDNDEAVSVTVTRDRDDEHDNDDVVAQPVKETEEERPGLGCGDKNHVHTGPPGNPGKECKSHDNDDGSAGVDDDAGSAMTATVSDDDANVAVTSASDEDATAASAGSDGD